MFTSAGLLCYEENRCAEGSVTYLRVKLFNKYNRVKNLLSKLSHKILSIYWVKNLLCIGSKICCAGVPCKI